MLWDKGAQHLMESHVVSCRTCVSGHGKSDLHISPLSTELFRHNIKV